MTISVQILLYYFIHPNLSQAFSLELFLQLYWRTDEGESYSGHQIRRVQILVPR